MVRTEEERFWFRDAGWCVLSPSSGTIWYPVNLPVNKTNLEKGTEQELDEVLSFYNPSSWKMFQIIQLCLLSKENEPPSQRIFNKLKKLSNYFCGKRGVEFLPCFFKVSKKKVPESMRMGDVRVMELVALPNFYPFNDPMEIPDLASPSFSDEDFSDTSSDSGIKDLSHDEEDDFLLMM